MQDLINEQEFVTTKKHNPWKVFSCFYVAAFLQVLTFYFTAEYLNLSNSILILNAIFNIIGPVALALIMVFFKEQHIYLPLKTLAKAIAFLMIAYYIGLQVVDFLDYYHSDVRSSIDDGLYIGAAIFCGYFVVCCAIILPIARLRQKRSAINNLKNTN